MVSSEFSFRIEKVSESKGLNPVKVARENSSGYIGPKAFYTPWMRTNKHTQYIAKID